MAAVIAEILQEKGACSPADLCGKGFFLEIIKRHWAMAYALAKTEIH
ncbi:MAG: hypothetical protein FWF24_05535 [Alphaproteobacteria bacterium]|nr:hypothetical protein [Alphaproteobacteria bacterium]